MKRKPITKRELILAACSAAFGGMALFAADNGYKQLTDDDFKGAYYWNGLVDGKTGSGVWSDTDNWLQNGAAVAELPSVANTVALTGSTYRVTLTQNAVVTNLYVGGSAKNGSPNVTLDLGGNTLSVSNRARLAWAWTGGNLAVTNGVFNVGRSLVPAFSSNFTSTYGFFGLYGLTTTANVENVVWGTHVTSTTFKVADGAALNVMSTNASFITKGGGNMFLFTGKGTKVLFNGGISCQTSGTKIRVENGAEMTVRHYSHDNSYGSIYRSVALGRVASSCSLTIDNARASFYDRPIDVGDQDQQSTSWHNALIVTNGARVVMNKGAVINVSYNSYGISYHGYSNHVDVTEGSWLMASNCSVSVGYRGHACHNWFYVKNATADVSHIETGTDYTGTALSNLVVVAGTHPKIRCLRTSGSGLNITSAGGLKFIMGAEGYADVPIEIANTVSIAKTKEWQASALKGIVFQPQLIIDAEPFARRHAQKTVTLVSCGKACKSALTDLATNATFIVSRERFKGTVSVSEDGMRLLYTTPPAHGLTIMIR